MIRFFRFSGPFQFGILFFMIWLFRMPLFLTDTPLLWEDVNHLALGEKLADGFLIYRDIIDSTGPLAATVYWFISVFAARSLVTFYVIAGFLLFIQSQIFKWLCSNNDILSDKGDLPALLYVVVASTCFDFFSLSPAFISLTFVLIALNSIFKHIKSENNEGEIFTTGLFLGLAYLTFAPALAFFILSFFTFAVFTRSSVRYYFLFATGFIFPTLLCLTIFFMLDGFTEFVHYYLFQFPAAIGFESNFGWKILAFMVLPSFLFGLMGVIRAFTYKRFIIYQVISQRIIFIWLVVTLLIVTFFFKETTSAFSLTIPFIAFFITHFFQLIKQKKLGGYLLLIYVIYSLRMVYSYIDLPFLNKNLINFNNQVAAPSKWNKVFENKKILVIGKENAVFQNNKLATCYFDFELSQPILAHPEYYENTNHIYSAFLTDMPDVIIDNEVLMPNIVEKVPYIKNHFYQSEKGIYVRK
ncbi:MAG: hypothetical protein ACKVOU_04250 [Cytophagales bacterium]